MMRSDCTFVLISVIKSSNPSLKIKRNYSASDCDTVDIPTSGDLASKTVIIHLNIYYIYLL